MKQSKVPSMDHLRILMGSIKGCEIRDEHEPIPQFERGYCEALSGGSSK
jgi:hypothetical protein